MLYSPQNPKSETIAVVSVFDEYYTIVFPESRDDFKEIVKYSLWMRWNWDNHCWKRKTNKFTGLSLDRAADASRTLIANGFKVETDNEELQQKIVSGEYKKEQTKWIKVYVEGAHKNWFIISWRRPDDYYRAARKISGSRYVKPNVIVPPEQFESVLGFAEEYGFSVSSGAFDVAKQQSEKKMNMIILDVDDVVSEAVIENGKPKKLIVPENVGVADEFKD